MRIRSDAISVIESIEQQDALHRVYVCPECSAFGMCPRLELHRHGCSVPTAEPNDLRDIDASRLQNPYGS